MKSSTKYFRFDSFYLNRNLPVLVSEQGQTCDLEPRVWQLLLLFCEAPQTVISRSVIIEKVYNGIVVSDNAVNKLVAKVRKALADTPNAPKYIKTIPKQGYSLVAEVEALNSIHTKAQSATPLTRGTLKTNNIKTIIYSITLLSILSISLMLYQSADNADDYYINQKLSPLTRVVGVEASPNLSYDGRYLIYQKNAPNEQLSGWWIKEVLNNHSERKVSIDNPQSPIIWSDNKNEFLYVEQNEFCEIRRMSVSKEHLTSSLITQCDNNLVAQLVYDSEEKGFYFVMKRSDSASWEVYYYNFKNNEMTVINQPAPSGVGNYSIDLSPDKNRLLILSSDNTQSTSIYVLNTKDHKLNLEGNRAWFLNKAIWHHDSHRVIHTSQHYARELLISNLSGDENSTLISTSKRILDNFMRHPNGTDYYFTSFQMDNDLAIITRSNENQSVINNSEVYEKMPVYNGEIDSWFFVSNRTNISQIYLSSNKSATTKQVSFFKSEFQFVSLDVSLNGNLLAFHDEQTLMIYEPETQTIKRYFTPQGRIAASSWLDNERISVSIEENSNLGVYIFNLNTNTFNKVHQNWSVIFKGQKPSDIYAIDKITKQAFSLDQNFEANEALPIAIEDIINHSGLQVKATGDFLIYLKTEGLYSSINSFNLATGKNTELGNWLYVAGFDAIGEHVILSYEKNRTGDIMRSHLLSNK